MNSPPTARGRRGWASLLVVLLGFGHPVAAAPPVPAPDEFASNGTPVVMDVLANDAHPQGLPLTLTTTTSLPQPHGTTSVLADGTVLFTPSNGSTEPATFSYTVRDELGRTANAVASYNALDLGPKSVGGLTATALDANHIRLSWFDLNIDETEFRIRGGINESAASDPNAPVIGTHPPINSGSASWTHHLVPTPPAQTQYFYTVSSCVGATCTMSGVVSARTPAQGPVNLPPTANPDAVEVTYGARVFIPFELLLGNDSDPEGQILSVLPLAVPELQLPHGKLYPAPGGFSFWQTPAVLPPNQPTDTYQYTLTDGYHQVQGTLSIQIKPAIPVDARDDSYQTKAGLTTGEGRPLYIPHSVLTSGTEAQGGDSGSDPWFLPRWFSPPQHGRIDFCCHANWDTNEPTGFWYVPDDGYVGTDTFAYAIANSSSFDTAMVTVSVTDNGHPDPTQAVVLGLTHVVKGSPAKTYVTFSDLLYGFQSANPESAQGDQLQNQLRVTSPSVVTVPNSGWYTPGFTAPSTTYAPTGYEGVFTLETSGTTTQNGSFRFNLKGTQGTTEAFPATAAVLTVDQADLSATSNPPRPLRAANDLYTHNELGQVIQSGQMAQIHWQTLAANDLCAAGISCDLLDNQVSFEIRDVSQARHGQVSQLMSWGGFVYRAPTNWSGVDSLTYSLLHHATGKRSMARILVVVVAGAPTAGNDMGYLAIAGQPLVIPPATLLANDSDPQGDTLRISAVASPAHGYTSVAGDGTVTYVATPGYAGSDSFTYTVEDTLGNSATATVTVTVEPVDPAIQVSMGPTVVANGGVMDFGDLLTGAAVGVTLTVKNIGHQDLNLGQLVVPAGYAVTATPPTTLPPGNSGTLVVAVETTTPGFKAGTLTLENNDPNDNPWALQLEANVIQDLIFQDEFDPDLSRWTATATAPGTLTSCTTPLSGARGLCAFVNGVGTPVYLTDSTPNAEPRYRARFRFHPDGVTMADGNLHYLLLGRNSAGVTVLDVRFQKNAGAYQVKAGLVRNDASAAGTAWIPISGTTTLEIDWKAADAGQANGYIKLWVNGVFASEATGISNDGLRVDETRLGAMSGIDAGTSGTHLIDAFESRRVSYIGPEIPLFADSFEPDLSRWVQNVAGSGRLRTCAEAATAGSLGLCADVDGNGSAVSVQDNTPDAESYYRARWNLSLVDLTMAETNLHYLFTGNASSGASVFDLRLRKNLGVLQLRAGANRDDASLVSTPWTTIGTTVQLELEWRAAGPLGNDGRLRLWANGTLIGDLTGLTNGSLRLDQVKLGGFSGIDPGTSGTHRFDAFVSYR